MDIVVRGSSYTKQEVVSDIEKEEVRGIWSLKVFVPKDRWWKLEETESNVYTIPWVSYASGGYEYGCSRPKPWQIIEALESIGIAPEKETPEVEHLEWYNLKLMVEFSNGHRIIYQNFMSLEYKGTGATLEEWLKAAQLFEEVLQEHKK